jgi:hypothetical protein
MVLEGALVNSEPGSHATVRGGQDFHVPVATREVNCSGKNGIAIASFVHPKVTSMIETLSEEASKQFGHVLHDKHRQRKVLGKCG